MTMRRNWKNSTQLLPVLLVIALMALSSMPYTVDAKLHVYIINDLDPGLDLDIHCKSKNNDLGDHKLSYGQEYTWSFNQNLFGGTLFWCNFYWVNNGVNLQAGYRVFDQHKQPSIFGDDYFYKVRKDGIYTSITVDDTFTKVSDWEKYN
ncbi:S-protein homolog 29-like [Telopea speciosissima]|uniref:S-protein homolog 29-like n=1 Tax=Telopea speciosissima TaxID=54955 RepID=UPI001CC61F90|nr:S-protein homolog 29-like [Telopea speciosissima]XP_043720886.1 S-protein homolog 29-like [Telopea speciosissima]